MYCFSVNREVLSISLSLSFIVQYPLVYLNLVRAFGLTTKKSKEKRRTFVSSYHQDFKKKRNNPSFQNKTRSSSHFFFFSIRTVRTLTKQSKINSVLLLLFCLFLFIPFSSLFVGTKHHQNENRLLLVPHRNKIKEYAIYGIILTISSYCLDYSVM